MLPQCVGCCEAAGLRRNGCPEKEHGVIWEWFLQLVCTHCIALATCDQHHDLLAAADAIWDLAHRLTFVCVHGVLAATVVRAQFQTTALPIELPQAFHNTSTSQEPLLPFPLSISLYELFSNLQGVGTAFCNEQEAAEYDFRKFVPAADLEQAHCAIVRPDRQLVGLCRSRRAPADAFGNVLNAEEAMISGQDYVRRKGIAQPLYAALMLCRRRVQNGENATASPRPDEIEYMRQVSDEVSMLHKGLPPAMQRWASPSKSRFGDLQRRREILQSLECPPVQPLNFAGLVGGQDMKTYEQRVAAGGCQSNRGSWGKGFSSHLKCVLVVIGELLNFRPGELILDWGSGCGHALSWAKMFFDVDGLGVEVTPSVVSWATRFSMGQHCAVDGRRLEWIPDQLFDHVFSYGGVYHLNLEEVCQVALQLIRKLRPGGSAFFGWNRFHRHTPADWFECFRVNADVRTQTEILRVDMEAIEEWHLFPKDLNYALGSFIWDYPAYSIIIRRLP